MKSMARNAAFVLIGVSTAFGSPMMVRADDSSSVQNQKNTWRNLGIAGGALALNGLVHGNGTETQLGAAGGAYSASRYEAERKRQSQMNSQRAYYHRELNGDGNRKYYWYNGHRYYQDNATGERVMLY